MFANFLFQEAKRTARISKFSEAIIFEIQDTRSLKSWKLSNYVHIRGAVRSASRPDRVPVRSKAPGSETYEFTRLTSEDIFPLRHGALYFSIRSVENLGRKSGYVNDEIVIVWFVLG